MSVDIKRFSDGSHNPLDALRTLSFKARFWKDNPTYFYPDGIWVFTGAQGSGKTLSAVLTCKNLLAQYPRAQICSNLPISGLDREIVPFESYSQLYEMDNGIEGIVFFLDELHVLWNSLESKNVPVSEMAAFCQMRKQRRVIIGTSQVYGRIAKPIREQLKYIVVCKNYFGLVQYNRVCDPTEVLDRDGNLQPNVLFNSWFFHSPELYRSYETLAKIYRVERGR